MSETLPSPWGSGGNDRSDLALFRQALRQEWPIAPEVKARLLSRAIEIADPTTEIGKAAGKRAVLAALEVIYHFMGLNLKQEANDLSRDRNALARERHDLDRNSGGATLAELVAEAEAAAQAHKPALPPPDQERTTQ